MPCRTGDIAPEPDYTPLLVSPGKTNPSDYAERSGSGKKDLLKIVTGVSVTEYQTLLQLVAGLAFPLRKHFKQYFDNFLCLLPFPFLLLSLIFILFTFSSFSPFPPFPLFLLSSSFFIFPFSHSSLFFFFSFSFSFYPILFLCLFPFLFPSGENTFLNSRVAHAFPGKGKCILEALTLSMTHLGFELQPVVHY